MAKAFLTVLLFSLIGCTPSADTGAQRRALIQGLSMGVDGLTLQQIRTFQLDLQGEWAVAFDPADPPGCVPGGLRVVAESTASPCTAFVLNRNGNRWDVVGHGIPGQFAVPARAPQHLGDADRLAWLAQD